MQYNIIYTSTIPSIHDDYPRLTVQVVDTDGNEYQLVMEYRTARLLAEQIAELTEPEVWSEWFPEDLHPEPAAASQPDSAL
jgi:hypothetical protein